MLVTPVNHLRICDGRFLLSVLCSLVPTILTLSVLHIAAALGTLSFIVILRPILGVTSSHMHTRRLTVKSRSTVMEFSSIKVLVLAGGGSALLMELRCFDMRVRRLSVV